MNDFFAKQENARRQSGRLLLLFALAVIGVSLAVYLVAALTRLWLFTWDGAATGFWHPQLFFWTTAGTLLFVAVASLWKIQELREGGAGIAVALGGKLVPPQTAGPAGAAAAQCGGGDGHRLRNAGAGPLPAGAGAGHKCICRRPRT